MQNPKTSLAAFATFVVVMLAKFGLNVSPDTIMVILTVGLTLIGHFAHDAKAPETGNPLPTFKSNLLGMVALMLCLTLATGSLAGCNPPKPPSRSTLQALAKGGEVAGNVLDANVNLPDQLLQAGVIKPDVRDSLVKGMAEARDDIKVYNDGMAEVLKSEKPDLKPLLPVALRLVQRIHALNRSDIPGWNQIFSAAEIGISAVATYFAIKISELRRAGFSDKQICAAVGMKYDPELFALIEGFAVTPSAEVKDGSPRASE
jgi:hypothetical protein